jgi:hypothetical protein
MDMYRILENFDAVNSKQTLTEGSMKRYLHALADKMSKADFVAKADEHGMSAKEAAEFWNNINGEDDDDPFTPSGKMNDWDYDVENPLRKNDDEGDMETVREDDDEMSEAKSKDKEKKPPFPGSPEYEKKHGKFRHDDDSAFHKKKVSTGTVYSRKHKEEPEADDEEDKKPKKSGRPTGTKKKIGAKGPSTTSKLLTGKNKGGLKEHDHDHEHGMDMHSSSDSGEYDDEAGMAENNLETLERAVEGIDNLIQSGDNLPEWCQEKIAVAKSMLVSVWDYMYSEEASDEVDPEIDAMFEAMQDLVSEMAQKNRVSEDLVWETFEAMPDNVLYETAAWRRKEGKSKKGGLNAKGVASYRRENPGSKLQMAVTTKPSKLKKGSKAAKRRKSFCARMGGVKGPMKKPNGKPTRKALALRKWNC